MGHKFKKIILAVIAISLPVVFVKILRSFGNEVETQHASRPVEAWKKALHPVGFKGKVSNKSKFSFTDRTLFSIELKDPVVVNSNHIPPDCEFFRYVGGVLSFAAYSETVSRGTHYDLFEDFIIEKKQDSDTLYVYYPDGSPKYLFELFDGIVNTWIPREWPPYSVQ